MVVTKLDGTAKGGVILSIMRQFEIPVKFVGVGEGADDLIPFDPQAYVDTLFE
jgi:fused signal recognition particle receptor